MRHIYGYMRISTNKESQKTDRQELALKEYAAANEFEFNEIVSERVTGSKKAANREEYQRLKDKLRKDDVIVFTNLDRLGRDARDIQKEFRELQEQGIKVVILDMPYLNEWANIKDDAMYRMITDILITLQSHLAEQEREKIVSRINQGLDVARAKGKVLGRPEEELSEEFKKEYKKFNDGLYGDMTKTNFAKMLGISRSTLYNYINQYEEEKKNNSK